MLIAFNYINHLYIPLLHKQVSLYQASGFTSQFNVKGRCLHLMFAAAHQKRTSPPALQSPVGDQTPPERASSHNTTPPPTSPSSSYTQPQQHIKLAHHADQVSTHSQTPSRASLPITKADQSTTESAPSPAKRSSWTSSPTTRYATSSERNKLYTQKTKG